MDYEQTNEERLARDPTFLFWSAVQNSLQVDRFVCISFLANETQINNY